MIAGVDIGRTNARMALAEDDGTILGTTRASTPELGTPACLVAWAADELGQLLAPGQTLRAVGICTPGPLDPKRGVVVNPPSLRGWHEVPLTEMLSAAIGCPAHLENDANLAGLGEFHQGAGQGSDNMVYVTWSTGVGAGLILDRRLFSGTNGTAGEIGHTILDPGGPMDSCGQRGCVEAFCGGGALARQTGRDAETLFEAAMNGDHDAVAIVQRAAVYMGYAIVNLTNLFDPQVIVIGGGVTESWSCIEPVLIDALGSPFIKPSRRPRLCRALLGDDAGLVGAVQWARENLANKSVESVIGA
jgi:glucokinase